MGLNHQARFLAMVILAFASQCVRSDDMSPNHVLYGLAEPELDAEGPGEALFLTPYIESGDLDTGRNMSRVGPLEGTDTVSNAGFLTVNSAYNSNMFFWFFQAQNNHETAPVLLWLQGGPGGSDMYGLFVESGPFYVDKDLKLQTRKYTWTKNYNMLYIDNPVGTGWSFTESDDGYVRNETGVANDLYSALTQFFTLFPGYANNDFYITGESYAGKYIPATARKIHIENPSATAKINLKGVAIGNGLIDPMTQNDYGSYLYNLGLIDGAQRDRFLEQQSEMMQLIQNGEPVKAFYIFDALLNGDFYPYKSYFYNCTGMEYYFNYLLTQGPKDTGYYGPYMQQPSIRRALHVGNLTYQSGDKVESFFLEDFMNSTKPYVEELLDNDYKVMLYNGQLDVIVPYVFTVAMINTMNWKHAIAYQAAPRIVWRVAKGDTEVAGYAKPAYNFVEVLVRDAGHIAPYDQPRAVFDMISRFIENKPWA